MKMRVLGNSIRLRLTQTEVAQLTETGSVEETIDFGDNQLVYQLCSSPDSGKTKAQFDSGRIKITVPKHEAEIWANSDEEGISAIHEIGDGKVLELLIEKDFKCLKPRSGTDDEDTFPHPLGSKEC